MTRRQTRQLSTGQRIAEARRALEMTQDALARDLGVYTRTVQRWEGDESAPTGAVVFTLADRLGLDPRELAA